MSESALHPLVIVLILLTVILLAVFSFTYLPELSWKFPGCCVIIALVALLVVFSHFMNYIVGSFTRERIDDIFPKIELKLKEGSLEAMEDLLWMYVDPKSGINAVKPLLDNFSELSKITQTGTIKTEIYDLVEHCTAVCKILNDSQEHQFTLKFKKIRGKWMIIN